MRNLLLAALIVVIRLHAEELSIESDKIEGCDGYTPITLSQAIESTILNQPRIQSVVQDVQRDTGVFQETAGPFDPVTTVDLRRTIISDSQRIGIKTTESGSINRARLSQAKKFRLGTEVAMNLDVNQVEDPTLDLAFPRFNEGFVTFSLTQPLLRGFVYGIDATSEKGAAFQLRSTYYNTLHTISSFLNETIVQYWEVAKLQKILEVRKKSVERFEELVKKTQRLIDEDQLAKSEINQPLSQLYNEKINLDLAKQELYTNNQLLKIAMGSVAVCSPLDDVFFAVDPIPEVANEPDICRYMDALVMTGRTFRYDLLALQMREEQFRILSLGAKNETLPELNVFFQQDVIDNTVGDRSRKFFSPYEFDRPEKDTTIGLSLSFPFCNDAAEGLYKRFKAQMMQASYDSLFLQQDISARIMDAWMNNTRLRASLKNAVSSVKKFQALVDAENRRLSEGLGSLFNLVEFENNLTFSQVRYLEIKTSIAQNLSSIYFLTGLLLIPGSDFCTLSVNNVTVLPTLIDCHESKEN